MRHTYYYYFSNKLHAYFLLEIRKKNVAYLKSCRIHTGTIIIDCTWTWYKWVIQEQIAVLHAYRNKEKVLTFHKVIQDKIISDVIDV